MTRSAPTEGSAVPAPPHGADAVDAEASHAVLETERLLLRRITIDDAAFILALFNEPSFIRFVGDRGLRQVEDVRRYITERFLEYDPRTGPGPLVVELKTAGSPVGLCTLFRREWLQEVDLGFAFLPAYWSRGYAMESARALVEHARDTLGLTRLLAIASPDNDASARLLARLGFALKHRVRPPGEDADVDLFAMDLLATPPATQEEPPPPSPHPRSRTSSAPRR